VISTFYRRLTGDEISPAAQFIGSGLLGGLPGLAAASLNFAVEEGTGQDIGTIVLTALIEPAPVPSPPTPSAPATVVAALADLAPDELAMTMSAPGGLAPGAIRNTMFKPLTAWTAAVKPPPLAPSIAPPPPTPSASASENDATTVDAKRLASNRAALLAVARDLRSSIQGHQAYNANARLKQLQLAQNAASPRPAQ
jgi:hypothetical protein